MPAPSHWEPLAVALLGLLALAAGRTPWLRRRPVAVRLVACCAGGCLLSSASIAMADYFGHSSSPQVALAAAPPGTRPEERYSG